MKKTTTLNLRVNPSVKERAEEVLSMLGIPMSTAIDIYLNQISLTGGIPFPVTLPQAPDTVNAGLMTPAELHEKLQKGYADIEAGNVQNAASAFEKFRESHQHETVQG
ncbi:MAG: type II toxin-antitoxin system RelB/DinJ family antitoxin [Bacillota bacterium]|nr:type II toxin-antitoxin system RelB/DinJ family antitoxin [Bacillota bacterium]